MISFNPLRNASLNFSGRLPHGSNYLHDNGDGTYAYTGDEALVVRPTGETVDGNPLATIHDSEDGDRFLGTGIIGNREAGGFQLPKLTNVHDADKK